jgi:hypothetical protein
VRALVATTALGVALSCGPSGGWTTVVDVDCGTAVEPSSAYEAAGRECVWDAYSRGRTAKWVVTRRTIEGDPIPKTLFVAAGTIEASQDNREDRFGGQNRGVLTWRCTTFAKHPVSNDGSRYDFYLSGCTGPSASTTFP